MTTRPPDQFGTITSEGGLLPPALLARVAAGDATLPGMSGESYHLAAGERFGEAISRSWTRLLTAWRGFQQQLDRLPETDMGTTLTRERWLQILFQELGYGRVQTARPVEIGDKAYAVSHAWATVPIHLVGARVDLERRSPGVRGAAGASPHGLVQELLNRSPERLWGFVSNGLQLRVLRDNIALTRQAFVEFDLGAMMQEEAYADFSVLWLLCHQSRIEAREGDAPESCWLELWTKEAQSQGARALEHLRDGVKGAMEALGEGFLTHPENGHLREALAIGQLPAKEFYRQLLRVVYRALFLLVAEERDLLLLPDGVETREARRRYKEYYSLARIRELAERRRGTGHGDLWVQLQLLFGAVGGSGIAAVALPALGSTLFAATATPDLNAARIANRDLLEAMRALSGRNDERRHYRWRFDYRNLGSEELGGVYESLLELQPDVNAQARTFALREVGSERRSTGSHYTPPFFIKRVLDFALEPQIAARLGAPNPEQALLDLRIIDIAVGSGHFLIAAAHRVARAVASVRTGEAEPSPRQIRDALRDVVARCIYGVDYNPMAVELCKVALWLETLQPGRPLSFLDHHIQLGNSLVGVPFGTTVVRGRDEVDARRNELERQIDEADRLGRNLGDRTAAEEAAREARRLRRERDAAVYDSWADAVPDAAFAAVDGDDRRVAQETARRNKRARQTGQMALGLGTVTVTLPHHLVAEFDALGAGAEGTVAEVTVRAARYEEAVRHFEYQHLKQLADTWTSAWFWPLTAVVSPAPTQEEFIALVAQTGELRGPVAAMVDELVAARRFFHFELAFPEVFQADRGGFDLVIGNPPYLGGARISTMFGDSILKFLKGNHPAEVRGREDLAAYFMRRGFDALRVGGDLCLVTTKTIAEGESREVGIAPLVQSWGGVLANAVRAEFWPGEADVVVATVHIHHGEWLAPKTLNGVAVSSIATDLTAGALGSGPVALAENISVVAMEGSKLSGAGFVLKPEVRAALLAADPRNEEVIKPLLTSKDILANPGTRPLRWAIDFEDRSLDDAESFAAPMDLVRRLVKPKRDRVRRPSVRDYWWVYREPVSALYLSVREQRLTRVIVIPKVSKHMVPVWSQVGAVFTDSMNLVASEDEALFGLLSSGFHWHWAARWCTTMKGDPRYTVGHCFKTFPRPLYDHATAESGRRVSDLRDEVRDTLRLGITSLYNRVHDAACDDAIVHDLRCAHVQLEHAVARSYGWEDLVPALEYGHHPTRFGMRWTVAPAAQHEIVVRLLELNRRRAEATGVAEIGDADSDDDDNEDDE